MKIPLFWPYLYKNNKIDIFQIYDIIYKTIWLIISYLGVIVLYYVFRSMVIDSEHIVFHWNVGRKRNVERKFRSSVRTFSATTQRFGRMPVWF